MVKGWKIKTALLSCLLIILALATVYIVGNLQKAQNADAKPKQAYQLEHSKPGQGKGPVGKQNTAGAERAKTTEESLEDLASRDSSTRMRALAKVSKAISNKELVRVTDRMVEIFEQAMERKVERPISDEFGSYLEGFASTLAKLPKSRKLVAVAKEKASSSKTNTLAKIGCLRYLEIHEKTAVSQFINQFVEGKDYEQLDTALRKVLGGYEEISQLRDKYFIRLTQNFLEWQPKSDSDVNPFRQDIKDQGELISQYFYRKYQEKSPVLLPESIVSVLGEIGGVMTQSVLWNDFKRKPREVTAISFGSCMWSYPTLYKELAPDQLQYFNMWLHGDKWDQVKGLSQEELEKYSNEHLVEIKQDCMKRIKR